MDLLRLESLTRYYGSLLAFKADEVALPRGAVGLLGPNGAGKSTLLKVLLGLLPPSSGGAEVLGLDVRTRSAEIRSRVGYLSESECLVPGLTAVEFVALAGEVAGMPRRQAHRRAHEVLACLDVEEARYRKVEELSTGMKQRVQLAQALVHDPECLILDEPTNGLDPGGRRAMLELIRCLHRDFGKSVILSSHLLDDVERVCDSVIIVDRGSVVAHGRMDVLRAHIRNRWRLGVTGGAAPFLERLQAAGVTAREETRPGVEGHEILAEVPAGFAPRRFFEVWLEAAGDATGAPDDARGPVLTSLVPLEEKLSDLFQRVISEQGAEARGAT
ncbi:MAG TPA: ABC transporter ATP-binding protein [Planctomycetota bacterium]|nr:ABC transporter ATP-binding protein [Planctomycetota bacterium]